MQRAALGIELRLGLRIDAIARALPQRVQGRVTFVALRAMTLSLEVFDPPINRGGRSGIRRGGAHLRGHARLLDPRHLGSHRHPRCHRRLQRGGGSGGCGSDGGGLAATPRSRCTSFSASTSRRPLRPAKGQFWMSGSSSARLARALWTAALAAPAMRRAVSHASVNCAVAAVRSIPASRACSTWTAATTRSARCSALAARRAC